MGGSRLARTPNQTSPGVNEREIQTAIQLACSREGVRLLRSNAGLAWQGTVVSQTPARLVLAYPRPIKLMAPGCGDLIGWRSLKIDDRVLAQFASLEVKTPRGRPTDEQLAWQATVRRAGGLAEIVRSVDQATAALNFDLSSR